MSIAQRLKFENTVLDVISVVCIANKTALQKVLASAADLCYHYKAFEAKICVMYQ